MEQDDGYLVNPTFPVNPFDSLISCPFLFLEGFTFHILGSKSNKIIISTKRCITCITKSSTQYKQFMMFFNLNINKEFLLRLIITTPRLTRFILSDLHDSFRNYLVLSCYPVKYDI